MRVGLMQEGHCPDGVSRPQRYREMLVEAQFAEEMGFDIYGNGEQHFGKYTATVSAPDLMHAYLAARTERIRLRAMSINLLPFNHPITVAERVATLDVISGGRAELGGARSNNMYTLSAFGIDPRETTAYRDDALRIIAQALHTGHVEFASDRYSIPERELVPPPVQKTVPIHISATGFSSHRAAGEMGIGVMTGNSILGWEYAQRCIEEYKAAAKNPTPLAGSSINRLGFFSTGVNCDTDRERAKATAAPIALRFVEVVMSVYSELSKESPDYAYLGQIEKVRDRMTDLDYLLDAAPYICLGTPDDLIERATRIHALGADDLLWRLDGMGHENNMRAIEMIGRHVLPAVHDLPEHAGSTVD